MRALGLWLMLVGSLRLASVWFGFFDIWALRLAVFSQTQSTSLPSFYHILAYQSCGCYYSGMHINLGLLQRSNEPFSYKTDVFRGKKK